MEFLCIFCIFLLWRFCRFFCGGFVDFCGFCVDCFGRVFVDFFWQIFCRFYVDSFFSKNLQKKVLFSVAKVSFTAVFGNFHMDFAAN